MHNSIGRTFKSLCEKVYALLANSVGNLVYIWLTQIGQINSWFSSFFMRLLAFFYLTFLNRRNFQQLNANYLNWLPIFTWFSEIHIQISWCFVHWNLFELFLTMEIQKNYRNFFFRSKSHKALENWSTWEKNEMCWKKWARNKN